MRVLEELESAQRRLLGDSEGLASREADGEEVQGVARIGWWPWG